MLFRNATAVNWKVGGAIAGQVKSGGGLSFITVNDAGHQVPMDQPANVCQ
jgi:carboxypeptidase C (cathepsin A)